MRKVKKPDFNVKSIVCDCAETISDVDMKNRIMTVSDFIQTRSIEYDYLAEKQLLDSIQEHNMVADIVTKEEMIKLYTNKFAKHHDVRYKYYDKIMVSSNGICPSCGLGQVGNLDHYLPKSLFPTYAVTPYNLVPICRDCNSKKNNQIFENNTEALLHPYYDEDNVIWLKAELSIQNDGIVARYFVDINLEIEDELFVKRCENHFDIYDLGKRYAIEAAREISENQERWKKYINKWGKEEFLLDINETIASLEKVCVNSWKVALYRALYRDVEILFYDVENTDMMVLT